MQVKEVMTADPACCTPETSLIEVAALMVINDCGEIPVVDNNDSKVPVGAVTDRDIVCRVVAKGFHPREKTAADCMSTPVITVTTNMTVEDCGQLMQDKMIRRVPVVDEHGACCGIVALADIVRQGEKGVAGEVIKGVSEPTQASSAAGS
jgi:CBS domain-containing protein